jgi:hypothetical protein
VVAGRLISMGSFVWFTEEDCGTLAQEDDAVGHVAALRMELEKWRDGVRSPEMISERWGRRLHEREVARTVVRLIADAKG